MNNRPVPTARRSLYTEKDLVQPNTRMAVNSQLSNSSQHYTAAQQARTHNVVLENPYARPNFITNVQAAPHQGDAQRNRPINQKLVYIPRNPTLNGNPRVNLRQVHHQNVPANMTTNNVNRSVHVNEAVVKTSYNPSINRFSTDLTATSYSRDYYPHQNFSFRRAVRRSLSSDSDKNKNDTKREQTVSSESQLGADKSSRKSDDRDSGTVVEPEASVFDFDSSVLSEEEKRDKIATPPPHKEDSRTSTPILPPLSSDDDFTDVVEPDEGHADISTRQSNASENRDQVRISQDFKQMHKSRWLLYAMVYVSSFFFSLIQAKYYKETVDLFKTHLIFDRLISAPLSERIYPAWCIRLSNILVKQNERNSKIIGYRVVSQHNSY